MSLLLITADIWRFVKLNLRIQALTSMASIPWRQFVCTDPRLWRHVILPPLLVTGFRPRPHLLKPLAPLFARADFGFWRSSWRNRSSLKVPAVPAVRPAVIVILIVLGESAVCCFSTACCCLLASFARWATLLSLMKSWSYWFSPWCWPWFWNNIPAVSWGIWAQFTQICPLVANIYRCRDFYFVSGLAQDEWISISLSFFNHQW